MTIADYIASLLAAVFGIALFVNLRAGTLGSWLKAKFLGLPRPAGAT